ncbi:MAG: hypothetical protein AAF288_11595 [Planctomycetota bacterium]
MELIRDDGATTIDPSDSATWPAGAGDLSSLIASVQERFRSLFQWHEAQSLQLSADRAVLEVHREQETQKFQQQQDRAEADLAKRRTELELGVAAQRECLRREEDKLAAMQQEVADERDRLQRLGEALCAQRDELDAERESARALALAHQQIQSVLERDRERLDRRVRAMTDEAFVLVEPELAGPIRVSMSPSVRRGVATSGKARPARQAA